MPRHDPAASLLLALQHRDDLALAGVLNPDVRMVVDSGDPTGGELRGRALVSRALTELVDRHPDATLETASVNGGPGLALRRGDGEVVGVLCIAAAADAASISELWLATASDKLAYWNRPRD